MSNDKLAEALGFLDRVHRGLISGRISEWPGLREACGIVYAAHATESAQAQAQSVVWSIPEARPKVTVDHDSVECGDLYTLEDACWNAGWNACREAMLAAAPQQAAEPVVWMTPTKNYFGSFEGCTDACNGAPIPLYTHPQPAQDAKDAATIERVARAIYTHVFTMSIPRMGVRTATFEEVWAIPSERERLTAQACAAIDAAMAKESGR